MEIDCRKCNSKLVRVINAHYVELKDRDGKPYQRYWTILHQCESCKDVTYSDLDI